MEIDEHLKYTLYVLTPPLSIPCLHVVVCNSTPAQEQASPWCRGGPLIISFRPIDFGVSMIHELLANMGGLMGTHL